MMMALATAAGHPSPASFAVPTGSGWVRPPLSLRTVYSLIRADWDRDYDRKLLSPIVTGCAWVPPDMKPGENHVDVLISITTIPQRVFVLMQRNNRDGTLSFLEKGFCLISVDGCYDTIFAQVCTLKSWAELFFSEDIRCCPFPITSLVDSCFTTDLAWYSWRFIQGVTISEKNHLEYTLENDETSIIWVPFSLEYLSLLASHQRGLVSDVALRYMNTITHSEKKKASL